jgi:hypothetical protein
MRYKAGLTGNGWNYIMAAREWQNYAWSALLLKLVLDMTEQKPNMFFNKLERGRAACR